MKEGTIIVILGGPGIIGEHKKAIENLRFHLEEITIMMAEPLEKLNKSMQETISGMDLIANDLESIPRNKKGKTLKPWEKKNFYQ